MGNKIAKASLPSLRSLSSSAAREEEAAPRPSLVIRRQSSVNLAAHERERMAKATETFNADKKDAEDIGRRFTMANREHWEHFQALLDTSQAMHESGAHDGELETETDRAVMTYSTMVDDIYETFKKRATEKPTAEAFLEETFVSNALKGGVVFIGHMCTDLDSVAGAIGAAALFNGIAVRSEGELNGEIMYALNEVAKMDMPPLFDELPGGALPDEKGNLKKICLVDHSEVKQMHPALKNDPNRHKRIVGLIDHHALAESFMSISPLFIDVRPWGSMSSIVAHMYIRNNVIMTEEIARLLLCAILSDTLNLQSVTTTDADRFAVALLARRGKVEDPDEVARLMFRAKTMWIVNLGAYAMVRGDQKDFSADGWKFGIAVLEVTTMEPVLKIADQIIVELRALKVEKGAGVRENELDFAFLFVVDVVKGCSVLLVCGGREQALAAKAFPGCPWGKACPGMKAPGATITAEQTLLDVGPLVSRKAQFVPAFLKVLTAGFTCHKERVVSPDYVDISPELRDAITKSDVIPDEQQVLTRQGSVQLERAVFGA